MSDQERVTIVYSALRCKSCGLRVEPPPGMAYALDLANLYFACGECGGDEWEPFTDEHKSTEPSNERSLP